jgi:hypothetical protein
VAEVTLRDRWRQRAGAVGFTAGELTGCLHQVEPALLTEQDAARIAGWLVRPAGLTQKASTFTRRDVLRGICQALSSSSEVLHVTRGR